MAHEPITALLPNSGGHQFVMYGDSCSGTGLATQYVPFANIERSLIKTVAVCGLCHDLLRYQLSEKELIDRIGPLALIHFAGRYAEIQWCLAVVTPRLRQEAPEIMLPIYVHFE
ncbi:hypothetical protein [Rhizobium sp. P28RR-XV]|uniref:hypothetical protein n=1 Tax=Rhizobium sp. P28RR-XV TaxID=2726737 RepID=UPI0014569EE2|nr:hypothetical protein [Rhizobium sp. P28RR-XV]NLR86447.1 hypothetical protein [Rhizobium sp. P28RR-XV]